MSGYAKFLAALMTILYFFSMHVNHNGGDIEDKVHSIFVLLFIGIFYLGERIGRG